MLLAVIAVVAQPALASREVESLRLVGSLAGMLIEALVVCAVIAIIMLPLLVWLIRRAAILGTGMHSRDHRKLPIVSLQEINKARPSAAGENSDPPPLKAQAEAIVLRPPDQATADVDDETRKRIADAVKRMNARPEDHPPPKATP